MNHMPKNKIAANGAKKTNTFQLGLKSSKLINGVSVPPVKAIGINNKLKRLNTALEPQIITNISSKFILFVFYPYSIFQISISLISFQK